MTEQQAREVISAALVAGWATAQPGVPLVLDNEAASTADTYARLSILLSTARQTTAGGVGNRRVQRQGWAQVELFGPVDTGAAGVAAMADSARVILELQALNGPSPAQEPVNLQAAYEQPVGTDGRWYSTMVRVPFWYVEIK